ncbi:MAG: 50S ribosomal protein L13 [Candidatus Hinthialibacter sp.]
MKTHIATPKEINETHAFHLIDAEDVVLGRLASAVALLLRGKHKPIFTPFLDTGDHVIIVNADKVRLTGQKLDKKMMRHHTLYPSGLREKTYRKAMEDKPELVIKKAVWGMLPKNRLGRKLLKKLRVYSGPNHPHQSAQPSPYEIK